MFQSLFHLSPFQKFQASLPDPQPPSEEAWHQYLAAADCPDALLFWVLMHHLPTLSEIGGAQRTFRLLKVGGSSCQQRFPGRPDLFISY